MIARRERTRHLIELGGLVQKAGLVELAGDDRATLLGAFLALADLLRQGQEERGGEGASTGGSGTGESRTPRQLAATWRRRGLHAFDQDGDATAPCPSPHTTSAA